jgi:hypothetical protein
MQAALDAVDGASVDDSNDHQQEVIVKGFRE